MSKFSFFSVLFFLAFGTIANAQTTIKLKQENGIYMIPCKLNNSSLDMIFDTGASSVSISRRIAQSLYKRGLITQDDFISTVSLQIADGSIVDGLKIKLKTVSIGNLTIRDVIAVVSSNLDAPLLLGQSALRKFGVFTFDYKNGVVVFNSKPTNKFSFETIEVNNTIWMKKNLSVTRFQNGDEIPILSDYIDWTNHRKSAMCLYNDNQENGCLYNYFAVIDKRGICPKGFRIPTKTEIIELVDYYGGELNAGYRVIDKNSIFLTYSGGRFGNGDYSTINDNGYYWTTTLTSNRTANSLALIKNSAEVVISESQVKDGLSCRCIIDE